MDSGITKIVEAINRVGIQNVSLLSRLTGMPKETIRYTLRKKFPQLGLRAEMVVDYEKLGLERYFVMLKFSSDAVDHAAAILERLARVAFLTYRAALAFESWHIAMFAVPVSLSDDFQKFLRMMIKAGILKSVRTERIEWSRHPELKIKHHDFRSRGWTIDWDKLNSEGELPPAITPVSEPEGRPDVDSIDTLVIKELEIDSWRNFADISRKLGVNDRTLRWHYTNHVLPMVSSYYVRWLPVAPKEMTKLIGLVYEFNELSSYRLAKIRRVFNSLPFTLYEGGRRDGYYQVHSGIPAEYLIDSLRFLKTNLRQSVSDWISYALDLSISYTYTIPYENFDNEIGWSFEPKKALNSIMIGKAPAKI